MKAVAQLATTLFMILSTQSILQLLKKSKRTQAVLGEASQQIEI